MPDWSGRKLNTYKLIAELVETRKILKREFLLATIRINCGVGKDKSEEMYRDLLLAQKIEEVETSDDVYVIPYGKKNELLKEGALLSKALDKKEKKEEKT